MRTGSRWGFWAEKANGRCMTDRSALSKAAGAWLACNLAEPATVFKQLLCDLVEARALCSSEPHRVVYYCRVSR